MKGEASGFAKATMQAWELTDAACAYCRQPTLAMLPTEVTTKLGLCPTCLQRLVAERATTRET